MERTALEAINTPEDFRKHASSYEQAEEILKLANSQPRSWKKNFEDGLLKIVGLILSEKDEESLQRVAAGKLTHIASIAKKVLYLRKVWDEQPAERAEPAPQRKPAQAKAAPKTLHSASTPKKQGNGGTLIVKPPAHDLEATQAFKTRALFRIYYKYEGIPGAFNPTTGEVYERGFECYIYGQDYIEEHQDLDDSMLRSIKMLLEAKTAPSTIFGWGGVRGQGFNAWRMNLNKIIFEAEKGHPKNGRLLKAVIYFQRITQDTSQGPMPREVYRYEAPLQAIQ